MIPTEFQKQSIKVIDEVKSQTVNYKKFNKKDQDSYYTQNRPSVEQIQITHPWLDDDFDIEVTVESKAKERYEKTTSNNTTETPTKSQGSARWTRCIIFKSFKPTGPIEDGD